MLAKVREICSNPPVGATPWKGREIAEILDTAAGYASDHGAFFYEFTEGLRDLLNDDEDLVFQRYVRQALSTESRALADAIGQRDHLAHVCQVYLCGWIILNGVRRFCCAPDDWRPYEWTSERDTRFELLNKAWVFTALVHDSAYGVELARKSRSHEQSLQGLFGKFHKPGTPGNVRVDALEKSAQALWRKRHAWIEPDSGIGSRPPALARKKLDVMVQRGDHGLIAGAALFGEAENARRDGSPELSAVLEPAAVAIACHDFRWLVDVAKDASDDPNQWLRLDLWYEPLGVLLHVCDELQEWDRERHDETLAKLQARKAVQYAATELSELKVDESVGVCIDARLIRRIYVEDKPVIRRIVRDQERSIAEVGRQMGLLFEPRSSRREFHLHARIEQTVEDLHCTNVLAINWPDPPLSLLERVDADWRQAEEEALPSPKPVSANLTPIEEDKKKVAGADVHFDGRTVRITLATKPGYSGLRHIIYAPGGSGKSTLLQAIARQESFGTETAKMIYVPQLSRELTDIEYEVRRLRKAEPGKSIVLLIDHLDRLEGEDTGQFWLEQIRRLPDAPWLHVVGACRPEELTFTVRPGLGPSFSTAELIGPAALFTGGTGTDTRVGAFDIERGLWHNDMEGIRRAAVMAHSMGRERATTRPCDLPNLTYQYPHLREPKPVITKGTNGECRFAHDALQDFLTAFQIADTCAGISENPDPKTLRSLARDFARLPRDILRLLLDFLSTREGRFLSWSAKRRAATTLATGLLQDQALFYWLYEYGRVEQAADTIPRFREVHSDQLAIATAGASMAALFFWGRFNATRLKGRNGDGEKDLEFAHQAASCAIEATKYWEYSVRNDRTFSPEGLGTLIANSDIAFTVLSRVWKQEQYREKAILWAREGVRVLLDRRAPQPLTPGWFAKRLETLADARSDAEMDDLVETVGHDALVNTGEYLRPVRGSAAVHVGTYFVSDSRGGDGQPERLRKGRNWYSVGKREFEKNVSPSRWRIKDGDPVSRPVTRSHGLGAVAQQDSSIFESWFLLANNANRPPDLLNRLLEAHAQQNVSWERAKASLEPGERMSNLFHQSLPSRVVGTVLQDSVNSGGGLTKVEVEKLLRDTTNAAFEEVQRIGEWHERYSNDPHETVRSRYTDRLGDISEVLGTLVRN